MGWVEETESKYLSSKDLGNGIEERTVKDVYDVEFPEGSGTLRHVLEFREGKPLLLNKTNMKILIEAIGRDGFSPSKLEGRKVFLMKQKVSFQGELVDGVRIVKVE